MTALDEFKRRVWHEARVYIEDGYATELGEVLKELGIEHQVEDPDDTDPEVVAFKAKVWKVTAAAADRYGWCSEWEDAMENLDIEEPVDELAEAKRWTQAAMDRLDDMLNRR